MERGGVHDESSLLCTTSMPVILVSRGTMSGGILLGRCLAETTACHCLSREELINAVNIHGDVATQLVESVAKASRDYTRFSRLRRPYKVLMRLALLEYALSDNVAYFGYSGHLLLPPVRHFLRVRLHAPMQVRVKFTTERLNLDEEAARDYIRKMDDERILWARFMYGTDIRNPDHYDLSFNMERMSPENIGALIIEASTCEAFQPTPESLAMVKDLHTATAVEVALLLAPETSTLEIGATASGSRVDIQGPYVEGRVREQVIRIARSVEGVEEADYQPGYLPTF
jgi:hypothetical protein